jgi:ketosteroid isomerase-like protein
MTKTIKLSCRYLFVIVSFLTLAVVSCNNHQQGKAPSMTEAELLAAANQLDSTFLVAFNKGDVNAFMQCYWNSPELVAYPPARVMQLKGYEAVKEFYTRDFAANKGARLETTSTSNMPFKDVVVGQGTFKWTMPIAGAAPLVLEGRYTTIKALKEGKMVIVHDHTSAPMMAEAPGDTTRTK